jgi:hypothetical protein
MDIPHARWTTRRPIVEARGVTSTSPGPAAAKQAQEFWCYKRGLLVLKLSSAPGPFVPTRGPPAADPEGLMRPCSFVSGQFLSVEWEPRVRLLIDRAADLVDLVELLADRHYQVDVDPPSPKARPFRFL